MEFARLRPDQLQDAIARHIPVVLPIGVLEYHGGHLPAGMDLLAVTETLGRMGDAIITLPPFAYGAASHAVAGPEGTGTLHLDATTFLPMAEALFTALLRAGFRNVHGVIHHEAAGFDQGRPTDLVFRLAARNAIARFMEATQGSGWWGNRAGQEDADDPFNWIRIHPLFPAGATFPVDHAGQGETSLMLALAPETVDLGRVVAGQHWYAETATRASAELGEEGVAIAIDHLRRQFGLT